MSSKKSPSREMEDLSVADVTKLLKVTIDTDNIHPLVVVVLGASGDLAKKKTYPCLWCLFRDKLLPAQTFVIGYARSALNMDKVRANCEPYMKVCKDTAELAEQFWHRNYYRQGDYSKPDGFKDMDAFIRTTWGENVNRIYYFAIPPSVYSDVSANIASHCLRPSDSGWSRLIIEKPFGHDLASSNALSKHLSDRFSEQQIYRIDHYLGKEMVQNLIILRFTNQILGSLWNREHVHNVTISFKEPFGTDGRGGYFDGYGIIRDVIQNHLMQIFTLVAMEMPISLKSDDIRNEKVNVLRKVKPLSLNDVVIGQYKADPDSQDSMASVGYRDDPTVANDSITPTYACVRMYVDSERWKGVPFILRAGKALNERKAEVRMQFKDISGDLFDSHNVARNELVIRVQPDEAVYMRLNTKSPGMRFDTEETELDLTYSKRYHHVKLPDAYERLLLDVVCGNQTNFVRNDELEAAWQILTPILDELAQQKITPIPYKYGSRDGPPEATKLREISGYKYSGSYTWTESISSGK